MSCAGIALKTSICFQGHVVDRSVYLHYLDAARPVGHELILAHLFWGYCSNLDSQADKGIHLAANPFSDSVQVSEANSVWSKYVCCLISKILQA